MGVLEHKIEDNIYQISQDGKVMLSVRLDPDSKGIIIETEKEVYSGPINLLSFSADVDAKELELKLNAKK